MGKVKKKVAISKKEEEQAQKVVKIVFVSLIILALIMLNPDCLVIDRINIKSDLC